MGQIISHVTLDAKGLSCPMPIVQTKKTMTSLKAGQVLEVQATDPGSEADIKAWAESTGHQYLGTLKKNEVLKHYLRKATTAETKGEKSYSLVKNNNELEEKMKGNSNLTVIDVREVAEYAFNHIPNTINIPFGDLENHLNELNKDEEIYLICRTGNRSDLAAKKLTELGFSHVYNVIPGMSGWTGKTKGVINKVKNK